MQTQNNVDPATSFRCRIVRRRLLAQEIDRFANTGITKFDPRNDDAIELVADTRGITGIARDRSLDRPDPCSILSDWLFPTVLDLPHSAASGLVVALHAILKFRYIDPFLSLARRGIVRIK